MDGEILALPAGGAGLWERVFTVAPLVVVGTREEDGGHDLAPKHQAMPMGWGDHFCFMCTDEHRTHANVLRTGEFTVSYPSPDRIVAVGQAAAHRDGEAKPSLIAVPTEPATEVDGVFVAGSSLRLECRLDRVVPDFGDRDLLVGRVVAASAPRWAVRDPDVDDAELIHAHPLLVHLVPTRFGVVADSYSFPFPAEFTR